MPEDNQLYYRKYTLQRELAQFVKYAWVMRSTETGSKPDLLIPDGYLEIIFAQKGGYRKAFVNPHRRPVIIDRSCIIGIQTLSVLASRMNPCHLIGMKLKPTGAHALFGERLKNTLDKNVSLSDFGVKWLCDLDRSLQQCQEETAAIDLLSETLHLQIGNLADGQWNELPSAFLKSILRVNGQISVRELAKEHCLSVRHFQRKFKSFFGISPKKFLNIIRFKHFYKASVIRPKSPANFLEYGYYDQMHFIKDFRKHLGITPSNRSEPAFLRLNQMAKRNT